MKNDIITVTFMILTFVSVVPIMLISIWGDDIKHWYQHKKWLKMVKRKRKQKKKKEEK